MNDRYIIKNMNYAAPYPGNLMRSIWALEKICVPHGLRFVYLFPEEARNLYWVQEMIQAGTPVYFKPAKHSYAVWKAVVKKHKPLVIHSHFWTLHDCADIQRIKFFHRNIKIIFHHHCTYFPSNSRPRERIKRFLLKGDCHIACGESLCDDFRRLGFSNYTHAENAIDFSRLDSYEALDRASLHIRDDQPVFLMFGHHYKVKGVDIGIQAMKTLRQTHDVILLLVVAGGMEKAIEQIHNQFGEIPDWLILLPPRDDVASYYHVADVFISPSRFEGFCYALPEAAYAGCRLIFSDIGGQTHAKDIPNSLCFESENAEDLAQKMRLSLEPYDKAEQLDYVQRRYPVTVWCQTIHGIYRKLLTLPE